MGENNFMDPVRSLEVWVGATREGIINLRLSSVAARAILKFYDPTAEAELRDPIACETYRYRSDLDSVYQFG